MIFVGLDPSFSGLGLTIVRDKRIEFKKISSKKKVSKISFGELLDEATEILNQVKLEINSNEIDLLVSEIPPPVARFSAGLYCLDSILLSNLKELSKSTYFVHPTAIGNMHGKRSYPKTLSKELALKLMDLLNTNGYTFPRTRISADESESFLLLWYVLKDSFTLDNPTSLKNFFPDTKRYTSYIRGGI